MPEDIDELLKQIDSSRISAPPELDAWINERLVEVRKKRLKIQRDNAYRRFLIRHVKDEYRERDQRDEPLCHCGNNCPLLRGEVPPQVLAADSLQRGIEDYTMTHPAHPQVLYEADDAWRETKAEVITELQRIWTAAKNQRIPDADGGDGADTPQEVTPDV